MTIVPNKMRGYFCFLGEALDFIGEDKRWFVLLVTASLLAALTEAAGIGLLIPILETQGDSPTFQNIPGFRNISAFFAPMDAAERIKIVAVALGLVIVLRGGLQYAVSVLGTFAPLFVQRRLVTRGYSAMLRTQISYVHNRNVGILTNNVNGHPFRVAASLTLFCSIVTNGVMLLVLFLLLSFELYLLCLMPR